MDIEESKIGTLWCDSKNESELIECSDTGRLSSAVFHLYRDISCLKEDISGLTDRLRAAEDELEEAKNQYVALFNKRSARVHDLQKAVWVAMDRKSCPGIFMQIAADAILEHGCGELADTKKKLEQCQSEIAELRAYKEAAEGQEPAAWITESLSGQKVLCGPGEKATNSKYWSDAKPLYTHPIPPQQAVPDGWKLVPEWPTKEQKEAGSANKIFAGVDANLERHYIHVTHSEVHDIYERMINAAPSPDRCPSHEGAQSTYKCSQENNKCERCGKPLLTHVGQRYCPSHESEQGSPEWVDKLRDELVRHSTIRTTFNLTRDELQYLIDR